MGRLVSSPLAGSGLFSQLGIIDTIEVRYKFQALKQEAVSLARILELVSIVIEEKFQALKREVASLACSSSHK